MKVGVHRHTVADGLECPYLQHAPRQRPQFDTVKIAELADVGVDAAAAAVVVCQLLVDEAGRRLRRQSFCSVSASVLILALNSKRL